VINFVFFFDFFDVQDPSKENEWDKKAYSDHDENFCVIFFWLPGSSFCFIASGVGSGSGVDCGCQKCGLLLSDLEILTVAS
jgi:hypothetical protein